uniref:FBD domain-containing protein n=1 Tax=Oryza punctata TaxID=4537 RepID=A0A0E0LGG0_ORYPU
MSQPVADISSPQLDTLHWEDAFDPSSVRFGDMANLKCLGTHFFLAYGLEDFSHNGDCLRLLQRFQFDALDRLSLMLAYMGTKHQIALVKRLFSWAAMLKDMTINFCHSITESMAKKVCQMLLSFSRLDIQHQVLYVPEDSCTAPNLSLE